MTCRLSPSCTWGCVGSKHISLLQCGPWIKQTGLTVLLVNPGCPSGGLCSNPSSLLPFITLPSCWGSEGLRQHLLQWSKIHLFFFFLIGWPSANENYHCFRQILPASWKHYFHPSWACSCSFKTASMAKQNPLSSTLEEKGDACLPQCTAFFKLNFSF